MRNTIYIILALISFSCESQEIENNVLERTYNEQIVEYIKGEPVYGKLFDLKPHTDFKTTSAPSYIDLFIVGFPEVKNITNSKIYFFVGQELKGYYADDNFVIRGLIAQANNLFLSLTMNANLPKPFNEFESLDLWIEYTKN